MITVELQGETMLIYLQMAELMADKNPALLKSILYAELISRGYLRVPEPSTPGSVDAVEMNGVEISCVPMNPGLRIDVDVLVDTASVGPFQRVGCEGRYFLSNRPSLYATFQTLPECIDYAVQIAEHGMEILRRNRN